MEWKTIPSFSDYEVNALGQIKRKLKGKILSQSISSHGYYQVNIANKSRRTHRLLAEAFIPNPLNLETVNHIDGNKLNNSLENLEWMSRSENIKHSRKVLMLKPIPYSKSNKQHHLIGKIGINSSAGKKIKAILEGGQEFIFGSASEASIALFGDVKYGKAIRQSMSRGTIKYKNIKFENHESN
jgi:hypothetical protein